MTGSCRTMQEFTGLAMNRWKYIFHKLTARRNHNLWAKHSCAPLRKVDTDKKIENSWKGVTEPLLRLFLV